VTFNRFLGSASDGQLRAVPNTVCDGYRVVERKEAVISLWCRDCVVGRCTCPLIATRYARKLVLRHRNETAVDGLVQTIVNGLASQEWKRLKTFTPMEALRG